MSDSRQGDGLRAERVSADEMGPLLAEAERFAKLGCYVWMPGTRLQWSHGFFRLLGLGDDVDSADGETFFRAVHVDDRPRVQEAFAKSLRTGEVDEFSYRIVRPNGEIRWLQGQGASRMRSDGTVEAVFGTLADVTEFHLAAERLAQANDLLAEIQHAAGVGTHMYEPETGRVQWSDEMFRIAGRPRSDDLRGDFSMEVTHPDDRDRLLAWGREIAAGRELAPLVRRLVRPDGSVRHIETRARLTRSPEGHARIVGVTVDVTSRIELEEQRRHAMKMEAVGSLAAGVAHDFNNYLTVVQMQLSRLRARVGPDANSTIDVMEHAVALSASLTRQLLEFARKQPSATQRMDVRSVVEDVVSLVGHGASPDLQLRVTTGARPVVIDADRSQIETALVNLLVNARSAMPTGGVLTVDLDVVVLSGTRVPISDALAAGSYARVRVTDTGIGIAEDALPHIFEPYFTTKEAGRGLGLASVYAIVRQHRGKIEVASIIGCGSTFALWLPLASGVVTRTSSRSLRAQNARVPRRILLAEDIEIVRDAIAATLTEAGHSVVHAANGRAALDLLANSEHGIDAIVTDVMMPECDGMTLARTVRERSPRMPVVFVTACPDRTPSTIAPLAHSVTLAKPFEPRTLLDALDELLSEAHAPGATEPASP